MSSRVARKTITLPKGVDVTLNNQQVKVKGSKGELALTIPRKVQVAQNDNVIEVTALSSAKEVNALAGTTRALLNNMVVGVSEGFTKKLVLIGVGYRAQLKGKILNLTLGFSHPVDYSIPEGISIECPSQTEIVIRGVDKQLVGQTAAEIRAYRAPEPYKGKGIRYADEKIILKETKKK